MTSNNLSLPVGTWFTHYFKLGMLVSTWYLRPILSDSVQKSEVFWGATERRLPRDYEGRKRRLSAVSAPIARRAHAVEQCRRKACAMRAATVRVESTGSYGVPVSSPVNSWTIPLRRRVLRYLVFLGWPPVGS